MGTVTKPMTEQRVIVWEELDSTGGLLAVRRARVPGGWLVYVSNGYHHHGGVTFYPDPQHQWDGSTLAGDSH